MFIILGLACFLYTIWLTEGTVIYAAQCQSKCHSLYNSKKDHQKLLQCLSPCDQDFSSLRNCRDFCKRFGSDNAPCHYSCKDFITTYKNDYGRGPCLVKKTPDFEYCDRNIRCDEMRKCCSISNKCEDLIVHGEEVRVVVSDITSSTIIARWEVSNISSAVYILQVRELDSRSIHYTEHEWLSWEHILKGANINGAKITGLIPGVRIQLRIAIVNSSGLQSIGPSTPIIRTLFNASNPSGPENIWLMRKSYHKKLVNVTLGWSPPIVLDVPVHSYRIYWKEIPLSTAVQTKKRTRVAGTHYNYTIENLKPDTTYRIEFEAVCLWKKKRLKSPKVALNISTGHIKENGKGTVDVYFTKDKTKKDQENNHPPRFFDPQIKKIEVIVEKIQTTFAPPSDDPKKSAFNSGQRKSQNLWTALLLASLSIFAFWTN